MIVSHPYNKKLFPKDRYGAVERGRRAKTKIDEAKRFCLEIPEYPKSILPVWK